MSSTNYGHFIKICVKQLDYPLIFDFPFRKRPQYFFVNPMFYYTSIEFQKVDMPRLNRCVNDIFDSFVIRTFLKPDNNFQGGSKTLLL